MGFDSSLLLINLVENGVYVASNVKGSCEMNKEGCCDYYKVYSYNRNNFLFKNYQVLC